MYLKIMLNSNSGVHNLEIEKLKNRKLYKYGIASTVNWMFFIYCVLV